VDGAFAARAIFTSAAIAIVLDATASQIGALIRAAAGAVVAAGVAVEALRADAFSALALLLRHSFPGPDRHEAAVGQFADAGGLELLDGVREEMDWLPAEVCRPADEFLAAYEDRDGPEEDG
jgi:hypothetical protein